MVLGFLVKNQFITYVVSNGVNGMKLTGQLHFQMCLYHAITVRRWGARIVNPVSHRQNLLFLQYDSEKLSPQCCCMMNKSFGMVQAHVVT